MVMLRVGGVRRALTWAHRAPRRMGGDAASAADLVRGIERAARYLPGATCLPQSLALARLLRDSGIEAVVRIGGIPRTPFEAHAWVESNGIELTASRGAEWRV